MFVAKKAKSESNWTKCSSSNKAARDAPDRRQAAHAPKFAKLDRAFSVSHCLPAEAGSAFWSAMRLRIAFIASDPRLDTGRE
jgi:hypothetical protein